MMGYGMPYMGSKRKLSKKIVDEILNANPNTKYFYDLFGGGGAISFEALRRPKIEKVIYNELNTGVTELLKKIQSDGVTDEFFQWISRDTFDSHKNDDDWFGGLCKVVWSFGNNQKDYLFGKEVEPIKKLGHEVCVDKSKKSLIELNKVLDLCIGDEILSMDKTDARQLIGRIVKKIRKDRFDLQQLQQLQRLQQLERLQRLQQLERLQRLQQLERLVIFNKSYDKVSIDTPIEETIIYLDPPYEDTGKYQKDICHIQLKEWIEKSPYKIYVSSYEFDLPCIASFEHRSTLSPTANNKTVENLYCNREHNDVTRLF